MWKRNAVGYAIRQLKIRAIKQGRVDARLGPLDKENEECGYSESKKEKKEVVNSLNGDGRQILAESWMVGKYTAFP